MASHSNPSVFLAHRYNRHAFQPSANTFHKIIGRCHHMTCTPVILRHLHKAASSLLCQLPHVTGIRATELINILVIVAHSYHPHLLIVVHQRPYQRMLFHAHVLRLINHQHRLANPVGLHFPLFNHLRSLPHHVLYFLQVTNQAQQVKTIGMKSLDFHVVRRIANQFHQPLLEFRGSRPGESQHQQLLVLHILQQQQRS